MMNNNKWLQYEVTYPHEMMLEWFLRIASNEQVKEQGERCISIQLLGRVVRWHASRSFRQRTQVALSHGLQDKISGFALDFADEARGGD